MPDSDGCHVIFNGHSAPDMSRHRASIVSVLQIILHKGASLCEHLKYMLVGNFHGVENAIDELHRIFL